MRRYIEMTPRLGQDDAFLGFQHAVTRAAYDSLAGSYATGDNEPEVVSKLVDALHDKSYDQIRLTAHMIHGAGRSGVQFRYRAADVTRELGDMVVISMVTDGPERILQRVCIIQNKKAHAGNWVVDDKQLFLLKNFPPLSGRSGIFRGTSDVRFRNTSGCLGAYGLLYEPGEMILASAQAVAEFLRGGRTLRPANVGVAPAGRMDAEGFGPVSSSWPLWREHLDGLVMCMEGEHLVMLPRRASVVGLHPGFLGNVHFCRDLHDFVRAWTQMSLGEYTCSDRRVVNVEADAFANHLMRSSRLGDDVRLPLNDRYSDVKFPGDMAVFVLRLDVRHKG